MGTIIVKCCVCGIVYDRKDNPAKAEDLISHGMCGEACANAKVETMIYVNYHMQDIMDMDRGFRVGEKLFMHESFVPSYLFVDKINPRIILFEWCSASWHYVQCMESLNHTSYDEAFKEAKSWAESLSIPILIKNN